MFCSGACCHVLRDEERDVDADSGRSIPRWLASPSSGRSLSVTVASTGGTCGRCLTRSVSFPPCPVCVSMAAGRLLPVRKATGYKLMRRRQAGGGEVLSRRGATFFVVRRREAIRGGYEVGGEERFSV